MGSLAISALRRVSTPCEPAPRQYRGTPSPRELKSPRELGIVSLDVHAQPLDATTPQGARLTGYGDETFAGGTVRWMFDAVLASNDTDTKYAGESGLASWQRPSAGSGRAALDAKGFGRITDLSVAMANDIALGELAAVRADEMTAPDLRTLVAQAGDVLGAWGAALEQTRELMAVRLSGDGANDNECAHDAREAV